MKKIILVLLITFSSINILAQESELQKRSALVIVDMQNVFIKAWGYHKFEENKEKIDQLLTTQEMLIRRARKASIPIVLVRYRIYGRTHKRLRKAVKGYDRLLRIHKNTDGLFNKKNRSRDNVISYLSNHSVNTLLVVGANGNSCVKSTIRSALFTKIYDVYALDIGIADFNYEDLRYPYRNHYNFDITERITGKNFTEIHSLAETDDIMQLSI